VKYFTRAGGKREKKGGGVADIVVLIHGRKGKKGKSKSGQESRKRGEKGEALQQEGRRRNQSMGKKGEGGLFFFLFQREGKGEGKKGIALL